MAKDFGRSATKQYFASRIKKAAKSLEAKGYEVITVETGDDAAQKVLDMIPAGASVGFGGSVTTRQLDLIETLEKQGHKVFDHWKPGLSKEEVTAVRRGQLTADFFLASVNAITLEGEIVNIDGTGNRVAASIYGPGRVVFVVGAQKIVDDLDGAFYRAKFVAAPVNATRLNLKTPCAITGECNDCDSPGRICNVTVVFDRKPTGTPMTVILVGEELGY